MADEGDDDEWKFSIDEVGPDADDAGGDEAVADGATADGTDDGGVTIGEDDDAPTVAVGDPERAAGDGDEDGDGNVAGALAPERPVESGTPELENVVFVSAGVIVTVIVFTSLVVSDPLVLAGVGVGMLVACAALYAFFSRY